MNRRSIQPTTLGCLVVVLMGQLHAWWLVVAWKDFQFILFATILATEFLRLSYSPREQRRREVKDYSVIILAMLTALFLDEPLRDLGGLKGYLTGATLQHVLFFFWMPRWIEKQMGFCRSQLIWGHTE